VPLVIGRCWLGVRKGIQPVKTEWRGTGMVICLERGADDLRMVPTDATATPSSLALVKSRMPAYPGCPGKRLLNGCSSSASSKGRRLSWPVWMVTY